MSCHGSFLWIAPLCLLLGCAGTSNTRPDDMSEEEHVAAAALHRQKASRLRAEATGPRYVGAPDPSANYRFVSDWYDPKGSAQQVKEHEHAASLHQAAADALVAFEEQQCAGLAPALRVQCPLLGTVESVVSVPQGLQINLRAQADAVAIEQHMRCHMAFARARAYKGMEGCPLYLKGLSVKQTGRVILLGVPDGQTLETFQQQVRCHLMGTCS